MLIDLHIHTNKYSSCSMLDPRAMVYQAYMMGLDGIAIIEHNKTWIHSEIKSLKERTHVEDFVILAGQEVHCYNGDTEGDIIIFGCEDTIKKKSPVEVVIEFVHSRGGIVIAAHPYRPFNGFGDYSCKLPIDGIEVYSTNHDEEGNQRAYEMWKKSSIFGIGGSDAHELERIGKYLTVFKDRVDNEMELIEKLKSGECYPVEYDKLPKNMFKRRFW